ncbi:MAG: hypothetical protein IJ475_02130 [Bacilli bacterium]|nr:hypothetical protein [Bacilli bacterium]
MDGSNNFLIPANSKKSMLILGFFTPLDLIVFSVGVILSVILLLLIKSSNIMVLLGLASPALLAALMVAPVPNYHNVMTLLSNVYKYFSGRKKYYWRGWCASREQRDSSGRTK